MLTDSMGNQSDPEYFGSVEAGHYDTYEHEGVTRAIRIIWVRS
jgi:hypothetical protein